MFVVRLPGGVSCLAVAAAAMLVAGCGRADYETRHDGAVKRLTTANKFTSVEATPTLIAKLKNDKGVGVEVSFRKSARFSGKAFTEGAATPNNPNEALNPIRLKPPFLQNFPGFQYCYESMTNTPLGVGFAYLYVGAQPAEPGVTDRLMAELKPVLPDPPPTWNTVTVDTPEDTRLNWKTLTFSSNQEFAVLDNNKPETTAAAFTLWMCEQNGVQVFLGYRWTNKGTDAAEMQKNMQAAAGTLSVKTGLKID